MKKIIYSSLLAFTSFILFSYSNGVFTADYTGSTGLGQGCAQIGCHTGAGGTMGVDTSRLIVRVLNASGVDVDSYTLGQQYTVEVRFKLLGATKFGFQCTNLFYFSNAAAGTISNTVMPTLVQKYTDPSGREYMSHTSAGTGSAVVSGGYATWKYKWTAPSVAGNAISFNCAVNRTNNDNAETGDSILISIKTLQIPVKVNDIDFLTNIQLYPNPAQDKLYLNTNTLHIDAVSVIDLFGKEMQFSSSNNFNEINIATLRSGNYFLVLKTNDGNHSMMFSKR